METSFSKDLLFKRSREFSNRWIFSKKKKIVSFETFRCYMSQEYERKEKPADQQVFMTHKM